MTISNEHVVIIFIVSAITALGSVILLMKTAPTYHAGVNRIRFILKMAGRTAVIVGMVTSVGMLAWGIISHNENLVYFSMMPLAFAMLTSKYMRRSGIT